MTPEEIKNATPEQLRARLAEIHEMALRGDYSWSFDEYLKICVERKKIKQALAKRKGNS